MLHAQDHRIDANRFVSVVQHGNLGLPVGPDPGKIPGSSQLSQPFGEGVGQHDGCRHQGLGLVGGVAVHHTLVPGSAGIDSLGDIEGLLVDGGQDGAGVSVDAEVRVDIADVLQGLANDGGNLHVGVGGDLPGDEGHPRGDQHFGRYPGLRVLQ